MDKKLHILVIEGTTRPKRLSINAAKLVAEVGRQFEGIDIQLIKPDDFNLLYDGNDDEYRDPRYTELTDKADGFFIVTPEYNHSYPGSLKRLLDSEYDNYRHKPVAIAGVSNGNWGGVRAIESLIHPLRSLGLVTIQYDMQFPRIQDTFDQDGNLLKPEIIEKIKSTYEELLWFANFLKAARTSDLQQQKA